MVSAFSLDISRRTLLECAIFFLPNQTMAFGVWLRIRPFCRASYISLALATAIHLAPCVRALNSNILRVDIKSVAVANYAVWITAFNGWCECFFMGCRSLCWQWGSVHHLGHAFFPNFIISKLPPAQSTVLCHTDLPVLLFGWLTFTWFLSELIYTFYCT